MKKRIIIAAVLFNLIFSLISIHSYATDLTLNNTSTQVHFSPNGGCADAIVREIGKAKNEVLVQAYSFTSAPIAQALTNAYKQGIKVEAILDKSQRSERYTSATYLKNAGIPVYIDSVHAIAHNKIMIIDRETVITGSFNFTKAAEEKNAENLLIIKNPDLAKIYLNNWYKHKGHAEGY
ncbi:MAG: phospholipase D family protein [Syntrophales bacterium]|jgi:phosphatidylserine/phosphatidylglycerophosphate/cardiolipin synthase-like enzyme